MNEDDRVELERWADIQDDPDAIVQCGERWKKVATAVGCQLHGFNDGRSASFVTPDGNVIEVGPKFRATIASLQGADTVTEAMVEAGVQELWHTLDLSDGLMDDLHADGNLTAAATSVYAAMRAAAPTAQDDTGARLDADWKQLQDDLAKSRGEQSPVDGRSE